MVIIDGKELIVSCASFERTMALKEIIAVKLKENGIKIDLTSVDISAENIADMEVGEVGWMVSPVLTLMTDSEIRRYLFECAKSATFNKCKIDADLFEDAGNRKYYYPVMMEVLKVNIAPFFGHVSSMFKSLPGLKEYLRKYKSQLPK